MTCSRSQGSLEAGSLLVPSIKQPRPLEWQCLIKRELPLICHVQRCPIMDEDVSGASWRLQYDMALKPSAQGWAPGRWSSAGCA